jgi:aminopeptidase N
MDAPDARATFHLQLVVARDWTVVGNGREIGRRSISSTEDVSEWRQERPVPTYTFGFAAGEYRQVAVSEGAVAEHYLANGFADDDLRRVFADTPSMLAFFTEKSGVPFPGDRYSQLLVPRSAGQEMAGYSIVSEEYGRAVLKDPTVVSLLAHELAHQWWGNGVTCREWTHFWLNEGFATFMAAAYREHRFGREAYLRDVEAMRTRYERVRDAGRDRSLVFPNWDSPTADDRTLVYQKGGYVLHLLRELLGDQLFWDGVRHYTRTYLGQSVTTDDFRRAMEKATGRDLGSFFAEWVYAAR